MGCSICLYFPNHFEILSCFSVGGRTSNMNHQMLNVVSFNAPDIVCAHCIVYLAPRNAFFLRIEKCVKTVVFSGFWTVKR